MFLELLSDGLGLGHPYAIIYKLLTNIQNEVRQEIRILNKIIQIKLKKIVKH